MGIRTTIPPGATPLAAVDAILALYGRESVEIAIETLIELLDKQDGDPEAMQANGDELDGSSEEEDIPTGNLRHGPGCPLGDPGEDEESPNDTAWIEQAGQTRPQPYRAKAVAVVDHGTGEAIGVLEDAEDDDPAEDDSNDDEHDGREQEYGI